MAGKAGNPSPEDNGGRRRSQDSRLHFQAIKTARLAIRLVWTGQVQRANASAASLVGSNIEICAKVQRGWAVEDGIERLAVNISERGMEETRANVSAGFDHRRNPGRVASRGRTS